MHYEEAQQIIETKEGDFKEEILKLDSLAKILRENGLPPAPSTSTAMR